MTTLLFEAGTAYDFFISLAVLHNPAKFGLRPQWAAGVRSRLSPAQRETLERAQMIGALPLYWLAKLAATPKDSAAVLSALRTMAPEQRLPALTFSPEMSPAVQQVLSALQQGEPPMQHDLELIKADLQRINRPSNPRSLETIVDLWMHAAEFGEAYLQALEAYRDVFFAEEETRIEPMLQAGVNHALRLAEELPLPGLIEELTQGVQIEALTGVNHLVLAPSFWSSPLAFFWLDEPQQAVLLFGYRPFGSGLIPGEPAPEDLVNDLKALADPTRLQILRYLRQTPQTPTQLAQQLRLRAPTVIHHLNHLRVAGLVQINLQVEGERRYALRRGALENVWNSLSGFLEDSKP